MLKMPSTTASSSRSIFRVFTCVRKVPVTVKELKPPSVGRLGKALRAWSQWLGGLCDLGTVDVPFG
jgi:hypothetical protein